MRRVVEHLVPGFGLEHSGKQIGIEAGHVDQGPHGTGFGLEADHGAGAPLLELRFAVVLQVPVQVEVNILAGRSGPNDQVFGGRKLVAVR